MHIFMEFEVAKICARGLMPCANELERTNCKKTFLIVHTCQPANFKISKFTQTRYLKGRGRGHSFEACHKHKPFMGSTCTSLMVTALDAAANL